MLSVVIVAFHSAGTIGSCLEALLPQVPPESEIVVVDNAAEDALADILGRDWPTVRLLTNDTNLGYAGGINVGLGATHGDLVLMLNPDARPRPYAVARLMTAFNRPSVAVAGPLLVNDKEQVQPSARRFPTMWRDMCQLSGVSRRYSQVQWLNPDGATGTGTCMTDWVVGACLMIRRSALQEVGLLDTRFFLYSEEVDLCRRLRRLGYQTMHCAEAVVVHDGAASSRHVDPSVFAEAGASIARWKHRSRYLYYRKHHGMMYVSALLCVELGWHALRLLVHLARGDRPAVRQAQRSMAHLLQAWSDTRGGMVSPPAPWGLG